MAAPGHPQRRYGLKTTLRAPLRRTPPIGTSRATQGRHHRSWNALPPRRSKPDTRVGGLEGAPDNQHQLCLEAVQVDLVAQAHSEFVEDKSGVIPLSVEVAIDGGLDTPSRGLK